MLVQRGDADLDQAFDRRAILVFLAVQGPDDAVDDVRRLAQGKGDAVLVDLAIGRFFAEAGDDGAQFRRFDGQRVRQVVHGGTHGDGTYQLVRFAARHVVRFRQQQFQAAAGQQAGDGRRRLRAPLFQGGAALGDEVELAGRRLPAEQRRAGGRHHGHQQVARVGQERRRFRFLRRGLDGRALQRGLRQFLRLGIGFDMAARQLVDRVQGRRHGHLRAIGQQVGGEMRGQHAVRVAGHGAGSDGKARPREDGHGHEQGVVAHVFMRDDGRFADGFNAVHQHVVGVQVFLEQAAQGVVDGVLVAGFE